MESDADVVSLIGCEEHFIGSIGASMIEGTTLKIRSSEEAVRFIAGKVIFFVCFWCSLLPEIFVD